jgi:hypothetical protein
MLGTRERELFQRVASIADPENNSQTYRKLLIQSRPPLIPYLGIHLSDLTFVMECLKKDNLNPQRVSHSRERTVQVRKAYPAPPNYKRPGANAA